MTGLFFKVDGEEKKPLVIAQHGGQGTPELISGVYGKTDIYNDMLQRIRENGVHVFAPQLLLWSDDYNVEFDRKAIDARLKRVGSSITAVEIYRIIRILDYFEAQKYVSAFLEWWVCLTADFMHYILRLLASESNQQYHVLFLIKEML